MKFRVEFVIIEIIENAHLVGEWQDIGELTIIEAETHEEAAKEGANIVGLEDVIFKVCELTENENGELERNGNWVYYIF